MAMSGAERLVSGRAFSATSGLLLDLTRGRGDRSSASFSRMTQFKVRIIRRAVPRTEIAALAEAGFGDMVKGVVDVGRGIMAIGGELHADEEAMLIAD